MFMLAYSRLYLLNDFLYLIVMNHVCK